MKVAHRYTKRYHANSIPFHNGVQYRNEPIVFYGGELVKRKHPCPCCGYLTLDEKPPGTFDICSVCFWEDDNIQFYDPNFSGGANKMSLNEAKDNFSKYGAKSPEHLKYVRKPLDEEKPDTEQWNG